MNSKHYTNSSKWNTKITKWNSFLASFNCLVSSRQGSPTFNKCLIGLSRIIPLKISILKLCIKPAEGSSLSFTYSWHPMFRKKNKDNSKNKSKVNKESSRKRIVSLSQIKFWCKLDRNALKNLRCLFNKNSQNRNCRQKSIKWA